MSSFESKKIAAKESPAPAPEGTHPRFDAPEDNVDPKARAEEEIERWQAAGLTLDPQKRELEIKTGLKEKDAEVQKLQEKITNTEVALTVLKGSLVSRIFTRRRIAELESQLRMQESSVKIGYGGMLRYAEFAEGFERVFKSEQERAALIEREKVEAKEDAEVRDVRTQSIKNNCFFVHSIVEEEWKPSANNMTIDTKKASFNDQVALIHGLAPTLSASTIAPETAQLTFNSTKYGAGSGVFLLGGRILGAGTGDIGSQSSGLYNRSLGGGNDTKESIKEAIETRAKLDPNRYNELVIANPEIAGIYVSFNTLIDDAERAKLDAPTERQDNEPPGEILINVGQKKRLVNGSETNSSLTEESWKKLIEAKDHGLPLYTLLKGNKVYVIRTLDHEEKMIGIEEGAQSPEDILKTHEFMKKNGGMSVDADERKKRAEAIFEKVKQ